MSRVRLAAMCGAVLLASATPTLGQGSAEAPPSDTSGSGALDARAPVEVTVSGLRTGEGHVRIALFDSADDFTERPRAAVVLPVTATSVVWPTELPRGTYALAVIHDRNGNEKLDTGLFGIPREPYGFSNGARGTFGPPSFEDAAFHVGRTPVQVHVEVR